MFDMRRREFITVFGGAAVMMPVAAYTQEAGRAYRLGVLHNQGPQAPQFPPFYDELRRLGFAEGQNLIVDGRGYAVRTEQFPPLAQRAPAVCRRMSCTPAPNVTSMRPLKPW
jgi:putative ABC transport system substrate-binding protein